MVATFILSRAFFISAMLVGALPLVSAAPIPESLEIRNVEGRNCRIYGCLIAEEPSAVSSSEVPVATASAATPATVTGSSTSSLANVILDAIEVLSSLEETSSTDEALSEPDDAVELEIPDLALPEDVSAVEVREIPTGQTSRALAAVRLLGPRSVDSLN